MEEDIYYPPFFIKHKTCQGNNEFKPKSKPKQLKFMLRLEIIGHLGANAELKTANGQNSYSLNIAHSVKRTNTTTGETTEDTTWVSATIGWDVKNLAGFLTRGTKVYVRGNLTTRIYTGHDGEKHTGLNISVSEIELC